MKLDYSLKTPRERIEYVNNQLAAEDSPRPQYLSYLANYILFVTDKDQTKKERAADRPIVTKNREATVTKRQTSFEQVVDALGGREENLYPRIANDKNQIMDNKVKISKKDIKEIPGLKDQLDLIDNLKAQLADADGILKYKIKHQIIEIWQQIYILRTSFRGTPQKGANAQAKNMAHMSLPEHITLDEDQMPRSDAAINLFNPAHVSFLLMFYSQLKQECYTDFSSDMYYLLLDLEKLADEALEDETVLYDLLIWKIDGRTNEEIQHLMESHYGIKHNGQYFSTLWRKRIPKLITEQAAKDYLVWHFTNVEKGMWKTCSKCGQTKLAHPLFFSKNKSKDGFYSVCKECRQVKNKR